MVRQWLASTFRYKTQAVFMMIGYIISFAVVLNGISLYWSAEDAKKASQEGSYRSTTVAAVQEDIPLSYYRLAADKVQCNVTLYDVPMFSDAEACIRLVRIGLAKPEGESVDGCVIGDALERYVHQNGNERQYVLDGMSYDIVKVINGKGGNLSTVTFLPYDQLYGNSIRKIERNLIMSELVFESNCVDTSQEKQVYEETLSALVGERIYLQREELAMDPETETMQESRLGVYMCVLAYIFCMINCIVVCEFWLYKRRYEIAVRRAFHFSFDRIVRLVFTDMVKIIATACLCYMILQLLILDPLMRYYDIDMTYDIRSIVFLVMMIPVSAALTLLPYMHRLKKISCAAGVKGAL